MRLFLKHILRSIKKSPLQPLIILLTLTVAVATLLTTVKMSFAIVEELEYKKGRVDTSSDITVTLSKSDEVRILFKDDAERIIGDAGSVLGEFSLTALAKDKEEKKPVTIVATELKDADSFYTLSLKEDAYISEKELNNSIILSSITAKELELAVGDTFSIELLGESFDFNVAAIAMSEGVLYDTAGIINIGAVTEALANANPFISAFADSVTPFTELRIKLNDKAEIDRYIELLENDEAFAEKTVIKDSENLRSEDFIGLLSMISILVCAAIIILISALVITTSLDLLSKERSADMGLFMLSGADTRTLNRILYLECLIYAAISAMLGLILYRPMCEGINGIFYFQTAGLVPSPIDIPIAILVSPVTVLAVAFISAEKNGRLTISERLERVDERAKKRNSCKLFFAFLSFSAPFFLIGIFMPIRLRFPFGLVSVLMLVGFIFTFVPYFTSILFGFTARLIEKRRRPYAPLLVAHKNMTLSYPLKHTTRLITILLTLVSTAFFCINSLTGGVEEIGKMVSAEYISLGADERSEEIARETDGVNETFRIFVSKSITTEHGSGLMSISASENALSSINESFRPQRLPENDEIILSSGLSILTGKDVGDSITLKYQGKSHEFNIIEVIPLGANIVFLDAEKLGEENELLCIDADFTKDSESFAALCEIMNLRGAYITRTDEVISPMLKEILSFADMAKYVLYIALVTTFIGIVNVLFSDYVTRKREKEVYYTVGMTKWQIRKVGLLEILSAFAVAIILVPVFTLILSFMIDFSVVSFGVDLIPI